MAFLKELIGFWALVAVVAAYGNTPYRPAYSPQYNPHHYQKDVKLHKLCSWNVVEFDYPNLVDDSWDASNLDAGRNYIPENNIPTGFGFSNDGRCFVSLARRRSGVYATLAYFRLDDIKDGYCPPLKAYPSDDDNFLSAQCGNTRNVVNIERFNIDRCDRLWAVDKQGLTLNDKSWELASPRLYIFNLKTDKVDREVPIPSEYYKKYQFGLETVIINVDPRDCDNAFGYLIDTFNGCIIVYSYKQNKFWVVCSPEFYADAKYSKFTIKTRKNKDVVYYRDNQIFDCTRDNKRREAVCHSVSSLDEFSVKFDELESEEVAKCSPDSLNVKFLGQKNYNGQTGSHVLNSDNQVIWGAQELNYGAACWNRENPLNPEAVQVVVSDLQKLPYVVDLTVTKQDLSNYCQLQGHYGGETYVALLSNNLREIEEYGFDPTQENFAIYFFRESEALHAYPQCLPQNYKPHYQPEYSNKPEYPALYRKEPEYRTDPVYASQPKPYLPEPVYAAQPKPYLPEPVYAAQPKPYYPETPKPAPYVAPTKPAPYVGPSKPTPYAQVYQHPPRYQNRYKKSGESEVSEVVAAVTSKE